MLDAAREGGQVARDGLYGLHWGDPESEPALVTIRDHWLLPHVRPEITALEIGPGGGRWTRYMLPVRRLYAVDHFPELLAELRGNFPQPHVVEIRNNGTDFPGVPPNSVDFVFSYGVFVHLEANTIRSYLDNLRAVIGPATQLVIHYSDKDKLAAQRNKGFSDNDPRRMRMMVEGAGYRILEEDTTSLDHSAIMRFTPA
ncbi:MAG TPA: class I SAM-dependent methyltransferase [Rhizomicrobium sp.]|nr:class I SAM-dependent methyltransferase [Rhizomicrobium sp.]